MTENPPQPPGPDGASALAADGGEASGAGVYRVELPTFEGPLDLLLHLIEEHELDILDIPIAFIAKKYVEYITLMQEVNIDVASEYLLAHQEFSPAMAIQGGAPYFRAATATAVEPQPKP